LPALLATFAAIGLLYLSARAALAALDPVAAVQLPPAEYSRLLRVHVLQLLAPDSRVSPDVAALARRSALSEPLAFEPFFIQSRAAEQAGDLPAAIRLMEEARLRRRNFPPTRLLLASYYTRAGRLAEALNELEVILALRPEASGPVMIELTKLIATAEGRRVLAEALAREPAWQGDFYNAARSRPIAPANALALLNEVRARRPRSGDRAARQLYIAALANAGQLTRARTIWLETLPPAERAAHLLMANNGLRGRPVGEPFGWTLYARDVGRAELRDANTQRAHMVVEYFGGSNAILAEQTIALAPGTYRLRYGVSGESGTGSSSLYWAINCFTGSQQLLRKPIERVAARERRDEASFAVPAGCDGQRLRLHGEAGDVPTTVSLRIAGLEIAR
jgi:tetratricopeptide (TPR) repeat protein